MTYSDHNGNKTCFIPNGILYPSQCSDIPAAGLALCYTTYLKFSSHNFFDSEGNYCNATSDSGFTGNVPYFYSNCTCNYFTPITSSLGNVHCTIQGYSFDPNNGPAFLPDFPTSSPYVTSVGATAIQFSNECSSRDLIALPEIYCMGSEPAAFSGGGGFSSFQAIPTYQSSAVAFYLQTAQNLPPETAFNPRNRGYPDIALNGHNYIVAIGLTAAAEGINPQGLNGEVAPISGTSASSPATAAIFTLINDYLIGRDLPTLGFLNPLLYQMASDDPNTFTDIMAQDIVFNNITYTAGAFSGCTQQYCCQYGFEVTEGWDPATGLGTPNYLEILDYVLEMHAQKKTEKVSRVPVSIH